MRGAGDTTSPEQKLQAALAKVDRRKLVRADANITGWVQQHCWWSARRA
jgi:hypothetical protein